MKIYDLFEKKIDREISGVIKVGDTDAAKAWTILDEYVVTAELSKLFNNFFSSYNNSLDTPTDNMGVWITGFFGSGKSHFLEILCHLLANREVNEHSSGEKKKPLEFFKHKGLDNLLVAEIGRAAAVPTDTVIFNIDAKAEQKDNEFAVLNVFLRVFNSLQGFYEKTPWIAELERRLTVEGVYERFESEFEAASGKPWRSNRDAILLNRNSVITALTKSLPNTAQADANSWFDELKNKYSCSPEEFAKLVKKYLDGKGPKARIVFLVDEVGQFIGERADLMLKLQTITEELGIRCKGRAWVIVTSQEDIDKVLGNVNQSRSNDFSKIQGRFKTRLSLSSANADEVIKLRILKKQQEPQKSLAALYNEKEAVIKNLLSFSGDGTLMPTYKGESDFAMTYPFVTYQFQLLQQVYTTIRRTGASGQHLAHGERSMIDAFQSAARNIATSDVGVLVPFYSFYDSIENSLEGAIKSAITRASADRSLNGEFDAKVLKLLFLLRNLDREIPPTVENLATLFVDNVEADKLKVKKDIEASLNRLERQNFIRRNDDRYFFLSDQEQEIEREIQHTEVDSTRQAKKLFSLIFEDVLGVKGNYNYKPINRVYDITRRCDNFTGDKQNGELSFAVVSPLFDTYAEFSQRPEWYSGQERTAAMLLLSWDDSFQKEFDIWLRTERYAELPHPSQTKEREAIVSEIISINSTRRDRLKKTLEGVLLSSRLYIAGQERRRRAAPKSFKDIFAEAANYLIENTYNKLNLITSSTEDFDKDLHIILTESDSSKFIQDRIPFKEATDIVQTFIVNQSGKALPLSDVIERHERSPYGWKNHDIVLIVARLFRRGDIELRTDAPLAPKEAEPFLQRSASWKLVRVGTKQKVSADVLRTAQQSAKRWFDITPQGDENLFIEQLREQLLRLSTELKREESASEHKGYPGLSIIQNGKSLVDGLLAMKESSHLLAAMSERGEEIKSFIESYEDVKDFYQHQTANWDALKRILEQARLNESYLRASQEAQEVLRHVRLIVEDENPFSKLKDSFKLSKQFETIQDGMIRQFRAATEEQIKRSLSQLQTVFATHQAKLATDFAQFAAPLEQLNREVQAANILSNIEVVGHRATEVAAAQAQEIYRLVNAVSAGANVPAESNTQPTQRIRLTEFQALGKPLTTADEVNAFIDKAHSALLEAVKKGPVLID